MKKTDPSAKAPRAGQLGPYPMEKLKRVENPTTRITEGIKRYDPRQHGFSRVMHGELGAIPQQEIRRFVSKYPLGAAMSGITEIFAGRVNGEVAKMKAPLPADPAVLSLHIKQLAYFLRADIVGICRLPPWAVYACDYMGKEVRLEHKNAIVIVVDQACQTMEGSNGFDWISGPQSFIGYSNTAQISCVVADYIRRLGYPARAHHAANYEVLVTPLLLLAGIGEMSRAGIVLNPFLGMRFKAAVVTTDLPLEPDMPVDFGLQKFCEKCLKCAEECNSRAISFGSKEMYNGYETWTLDGGQCAKFRVTNPHGSSCGRCIKVCPWNKRQGWTHDVVRWMIKHTPSLDPLMVRMDTLLGYGKPDKQYKWWFDLEETQGVLSTPDNKPPVEQ